MTLITQSTRAVGVGNNATTTWPFLFLVPSIDALTITLVDIASGNPTVISPVNYSVTGLGNPSGGVVTYPLSGSPLTPATYIVMERFVVDVQETDLTNQGAVYPADIEDALDYLTMITQQLQDQVNRSIIFSPADTTDLVNLPTPEGRAGRFLGFGVHGEPIAVDGLTAGTTVSAAMIPVVTAPTTAAALAALGLPGALLDLLIPSGTCWEYDAAGAAPTGFVYPIGQACTSTYPNYRAKLIAAGSPYGTNGADPLMPDRRSTVAAGKSNMSGVDNGLLTGGTVLGAVLGGQTASLALSNLPTGITSTVAVTTATTNVGHIPLSNSAVSNLQTQGAATTNITPNTNSGTWTDTTSLTGTGSGSATSNNTGATAHANVQPTFICNYILKVH